MASGPQQFYNLWKEDNIRETLFSLLPKSDLCNVRLASSACCNLLTKRLFLRTHLTFTPASFTKPSRVQALARIGHHIEHLQFYFPHTDATFLPPLIHPESGHEINFLYTPHTSMVSVITRPRYASTELGEILTQQYPPLFHAATNVPSFINAIRHLPNLRHLTIKCPGQNPSERYRRDAVDYALISLRIAVERAPLVRLVKLSLSDVHPAAFNYLRHVPGFGSVPSASRRWRQIRKLHIHVDSWDFYGPSPGLDHLKIIDDYIRGFAPNLEKFSFSWLGSRRGPCPVALTTDPLFAPPRHSRKLFNEVTSPMSPLPAAPGRKPIIFPRLRYMQIRNVTMSEPQLSNIVETHRRSVKEFDFENVVLLDGGNWDDALAPLMAGSPSTKSEVWSRSSTDARSFQTASSGDDDIPSPSAAVAAASLELRGSVLGISFDELVDGIDYDGDRRGTSPGDASEHDQGVSITTRLTKKRSHRRRKRKASTAEPRGEERENRKEPSRGGSRYHRFRPHLRGRSSESEGRNSEKVTSSPPASAPSSRPTTPAADAAAAALQQEGLVISAPIPNMDPQPVLLQPTVYDPSAAAGLRHPDDGITSVQRNIEQEETQRLLAEDAAMRNSALRKAKEAVLAKLAREFQKMKVPAPEGCGVAASAAMGSRFREGLFNKNGVSVLSDHRGLESQSALVPLMFSRA